jgi:hypothetical protein
MATYKSIRYITPDLVVEHTDSINVLSDVDTSTVAPEIGQTLKWIGNSKWKPSNIDSTNQGGSISSPGVATMVESNVTGRAVATILSSDPENDAMIYSITAGNTGNAFTINNTGAITTAAALDYETTNSYTLTISGSDAGGNQTSTTQTVNVTNNPDPVISNTSSVTLAENASIGTSISTISATDPDGDETMTYSITAGNIGNAFIINSSTGAIITSAKLDYEMTTAYNLTITATDASGEFGTVTQTVNITDVTETPPSPSQKAIFALGNSGNGQNTRTNVSNLVSSTGVIATDTSTAASARTLLAASSYGGDKAIFGFGDGYGSGYGTKTNITNLVSNTGVMSSDVTGVGTIRRDLAAAGYGEDKGIFFMGGFTNTGKVINLISNTGVVASDTTNTSDSISQSYTHAGATFGYDKAIFAFGIKLNQGATNNINLVNNSGVVYSDTNGVGSARSNVAASSYGGDKVIFGFGFLQTNTTNLVSNLGVVASDTTGIGTPRWGTAGVGYGGDKAIFAYGIHYEPITYLNLSNYVSNTGVMASDTTGVGQTRRDPAAAGFSTTA